MRKIYFLLFTLFSLLTLGACERGTKVIYGMRVEEHIGVAYDASDGAFEYTLHSAIDPATVTVSATVNGGASWITSVDVKPNVNSGKGRVSFSLEQNDSELSRTVTITLSATAHQTQSIKITQFGTPTEEANHTLMFLFLGTSLNRYFDTNIDDAKKAIMTGILDDSNRVLLFRQDNMIKAHISELCYDTTTKMCIERRVVENISLPSSQLTAEELASLINTMIAEAPAQRYGIVLAGHGTAWLPRDVVNNNKSSISALGTYHNVWTPAPGAEVTRTYGERDNVHFNIPELATALEQLDVDLDYILFDACFMSNIESIYDLRNSANYIIASPCEIMGRGFPYERTLPHLFVDNGMTTDYIKAGESYYKFYRDEYTNQARSGSIAVIDCNEIDALADATKSVLESMSTGYYNRNTLQTYEGQDIHYFFDFGEWISIVATDNAALEAFNAQLNKTVIAKYSLDTFYSAYGSYGTHAINLDVYSGITTSAPTEADIYGYMLETNWCKYVWSEKAKEVVE